MRAAFIGAVAALVLGAPAAVLAQEVPAPTGEEIAPDPAALPLVIIDPGHGGRDAGATGLLPDGTETGLTPRRDGRGRVRIYEKDVNLDLAVRLQGYLVGRGYPTVMTRTIDKAGGDRPFRGVSRDLRDRVRIANRAARAQPDRESIFISLHSNAFRPTSRGTETFHFYAAGAPARRLARLVHQEVLFRIGLADRGVKRAGFFVLKRTTMPAILLEGAFLSNPDEALLLASPDFRQQVVEGAGAGIERYVREEGATPSPPTAEPAPVEPLRVRYWVTAGVFAKRSEALRRLRRVKRLGFDAVVRPRHHPRLERNVFHVVTGQFIFLRNAKEMRAQLRGKGLPGKVGSALAPARTATARRYGRGNPPCS
ncbi:MAG: N-acetylmuramoyl-L-alanine amidase [Miltoncostaeaceae bacterium]